MKKHIGISTVDIYFTDGSYVKWRCLGKQQRLYKDENRYAVQVRVEDGPNSIDQYFETWDKPSTHRAIFFIKTAIKYGKIHE